MSAFRSNQKVIEIDLCNSEEEDEGFSWARLQHNASNIVSSNDAFDSEEKKIINEIKELFKRYNADKLGEIDTLLKKYKPSELLQKIKAKYEKDGQSHGNADNEQEEIIFGEFDTVNTFTYKTGSRRGNKPVEQLHAVTEEVLRTYPSGTDAAEYMKISQGGISLCCSGKQQEFCGYRWRFYSGPSITDFEELNAAQLNYDAIIKLSQKGSVKSVHSSMKVARKIPAASSSRIPVSSSSATPIASSSSNSMINEIPNNSRSTPVAGSSREPLNSSSRSSAPSSSKNAFDIDLTADSQTSVDIPYIRPNPSMYVEIVTSVFPDAQLACITKLLKKYGNDVDSVVQDMISNGYEKVEIINVVKPKELDYRSTSWVTSTSYREVALSALSNDFPFIHVKSIGKIFENNNYHYYPSLAWLEKELKVERCRWNFQNKLILEVHLLNPGLRDSCKKLNLVYKNIPKNALMCPLGEDPTFFKELKWLEGVRASEAQVKLQQQEEEEAYAYAAAIGALIECGCCYGEYAIEQLIQCSDGHLFCKSCLSHYVEQTLFGDGKTQLKCMNSTGAGCVGYFTDQVLQRSLSAKVYEKYQEAITRDAIKLAAINLVACHDCNMQVEMSDDAGIILNCPSCSKLTCRNCGNEAHIPLRCEEVESKSKTDIRLAIEEAMSEARIRECPKCKNRFYKIEGCNKMSCKCGAFICYQCRADITKQMYAHFCQKAHCNHKSCHKCTLYSDSVADDRQAMLDAAIKTKQNKLVELGNTDKNEKDGKNADAKKLVDEIDINKLLEGGNKGKQQPPRIQQQPPRPVMPVPPQYLHDGIYGNMMRNLDVLLPAYMRTPQGRQRKRPRNI